MTDEQEQALPEGHQVADPDFLARRAAHKEKLRQEAEQRRQ